MTSTTEPLLDLSTQVVRPHIVIDSQQYEYRHPDELSVVQLQKITENQNLVVAMKDKPYEEMTKNDAQLIERKLDDSLTVSLIGLPDDKFGDLSTRQKTLILEKWYALYFRENGDGDPPPDVQPTGGSS